MSRVNLASDSKQYVGIYRLFWVVWTIMLLSAILVAPFMKPLYQNWNITEWSIDYSDGFVRRGLFGAGINWFRQWQIQPLPLIFGIASTAYICTSLLWIKAIRRIHSKLSQNELLLLLFNPCTILFFTLDGSPLRKDIFPILFTMISLSIVRSIDPQRHQFSIKFILFSLWQAVCGVILALSHEGIALFFWLPINWLLFAVVSSKLTYPQIESLARQKLVRYLWQILVFLPTIVACAAAIKWSGNSGTALAICKNWESVLAVNCATQSADTAAISALSWDLSEAWSKSGFTLLDTGVVLLWFIPFWFWTGIHLRIANKVSISPSFSVKIAAWIGIFTLPIYLIGWDWGRWFAMQSMLILATVLILADSQWSADLEARLDLWYRQSSIINRPFRWSQNFSQFILDRSTKYFNFSASTLWYSGVIGLPHCCATTLAILVKGFPGGFIVAAIRLFTIDLSP
ncbi:hypothetical protein [Chamaesiphon polymorphus]|nr:hypothetical protein [Chamaesiphon polymorphus]